MWGYLVQAKLASCYHWLVKFIAKFGGPIAYTHAHREETRLDSFRENLSGFLVLSKGIQPKEGGILKDFGILVVREGGVFLALVKELEPTGCLFLIKPAARKAIQDLADQGASDVSANGVRKGNRLEGRGIRNFFLEVKVAL